MRQDTLATRARLISSAERLFATRGVDAVSLNEVGRDAEQRNRSVTQYHFGDKRGLLTAILDKHTPAIALQRHAMLDAIEVAGPPALLPLVEALVRPIVEKLDDPDGGAEFVQISAQLIGHPSYALLELSKEQPNPGTKRLSRLVGNVCPIPPRVRLSRFHLVTGMLFHGVADHARLAQREELHPASRVDLGACLVDAIATVLAR